MNQAGSAPSHPAVAKALRIEAELNRYIIGRQEEIRGALLALAARQHMFMLGAPGTAKSYLASELCRRIRGASFFKIDLNAYTLPDSLFGPISLSAMRDRDALERRVAGFLPTADIAQLDEIWKCPPATLNTLLTLLNEREYRNDTVTLRAPLVTTFVTSNELPPPDRSLDALYDRILLRYNVAPLLDREDRRRAAHFSLLMRAFEAAARRVADDLAEARAAVLSEQLSIMAAEQQAELSIIDGSEATTLDSDEERPRSRTRLIREIHERHERARTAACADSAGHAVAAARPDRWLIDTYGELFSSAAARALLAEGRLPSFLLPGRDDEAELLAAMISWADEHALSLPYESFLSRRDLDRLHALVLGVTMPETVEDVFYRIIGKLSSIGVSVRRETELRALIAAAAVFDGRSAVAVKDLDVLRHALWSTTREIADVRAAVEEETGNVERELAALYATIATWVLRPEDGDVPADRFNKLQQMNRELTNFERIAEAYSGNAEVAEAVAEARQRRNEYERQWLTPTRDAPVPDEPDES